MVFFSHVVVNMDASQSKGFVLNIVILNLFAKLAMFIEALKYDRWSFHQSSSGCFDVCSWTAEPRKEDGLLLSPITESESCSSQLRTSLNLAQPWMVSAFPALPPSPIHPKEIRERDLVPRAE